MTPAIPALAGFLALAACLPSQTQRYVSDTYGAAPAETHAYRDATYAVSDLPDRGRLRIQSQASLLRGAVTRTPSQAVFRDAAEDYLGATRPGCTIVDTASLTESSVNPYLKDISAPAYEVFYAC